MGINVSMKAVLERRYHCRLGYPLTVHFKALKSLPNHASTQFFAKICLLLLTVTSGIVAILNPASVLAARAYSASPAEAGFYSWPSSWRIRLNARNHSSPELAATGGDSPWESLPNGKGNALRHCDWSARATVYMD